MKELKRLLCWLFPSVSCSASFIVVTYSALKKGPNNQVKKEEVRTNSTNENKLEKWMQVLKETFTFDFSNDLQKKFGGKRAWKVEQVVEWINKQKLLEDYSHFIRNEHITGLALETMKKEEDWRQLGVVNLEDQKVLANAVQSLFYSATK